MSQPFVLVHRTSNGREAILAKTNIANTKKLRPRLEVMDEAVEGVDLSVSEWGRVISLPCVAGQEA